MAMFPEFIKNIARRHRSLALRFLTLTNSIRGLPMATRVLVSGRRRLATNLIRRDRRVVFVSQRPGQREAKLAFGLRQAGWDVIQLHREPPTFADRDNFSDFQQFSSPWHAVELAHRVKARLFHAFAPNCDDTCTRLIDHKPGRVIVDFYDYFHSVADGIPALEARYAVDIARQRHCIEGADAVCCRDLQMQYGRRETRFARAAPLIYFPEYCWNSTSLRPPRTEKAIHIVQIGWMGFETRGVDDSGSFRLLKQFVNAGCHVHIYVHPTFPPIGSKDFETLFADYLRLAEETGRMHLHPTVPADRLIEEISDYDFGFNLNNAMVLDIPWRATNPRRFPYCGSSRMFDYLDAGLGLILSPQLKLMIHQFRGTGMVVNGAALLRSGNILEGLQRAPRDLVAAARERLSIRRHIHRLTAFYERIA
jgi:hypothetical protein